MFENALAGFAQERGVRFVDGARVRKFTLSDGISPHTLSYEKDGETVELQARWLLDASGRAGMIKRHLDLAELNDHDANAIWFRISERIDINDRSDDAAWLDRCNPPNRWLSTNHLMGEGYWAWLIPLASGSHSVGIVADAKLRPIETMSTFDKAMTWFEKHQPRLFEALDNKRDKLQDFAFFKRFSYGCEQVFSGKQRWALTGEAGVFLDPFYSPGSDFIAIGNTSITELIAQERAGGPVEMYAGIYQQSYFSLYQNMLPLYTGQYKLFGDPEVMPVKVIWDYAYYWGVMCQLFFQNRLTDVVAMGRMRKTLANVQQLNIAMQAFLLAWHGVSKQRNPAQMLDQARLDWFAEMKRGLTDELDEAGFKQRVNEILAQPNALAREIVLRATNDHPSLDGSEVLTFTNREASENAASMLFAQAA